MDTKARKREQDRILGEDRTSAEPILPPSWLCHTPLPALASTTHLTSAEAVQIQCFMACGLVVQRPNKTGLQNIAGFHSLIGQNLL